MVAGWGAAGEQCPVPGQGGSGPPLSLPTALSPVAVVTRGGSRDGSAVCSVTQEPVGQTLPRAVW